MTQRNFAVDQGLQINSTVGNTTIDNNGITQMPDQDFTILVQDADDDDYALNLDVDDGAGNILARAQLTRDDFAITTDFAGAGHNWTFDNTGRLNLPGNIAFSPTGGNASFYAVDDGSTGSVELKTISYAGDLLGSNIRVTQSNATISTGNAAHTWTFDNTGNLTFPGGDAAIVPDLGGTTSFQGAANTGVVVTSSGNAGSVTTSWVDQTENMANAKTASMTLNVGGAADAQIQVADLGANSINNWTFDNTGNLTLPGNGLIKTSSGNLTIKASGETSSNPAVANSVIIQGGNTGTGNGGHIVLVSGRAPGAGGFAGNVNIIAANGAGINGIVSVTTAGGTWAFDGAGNLTLPGNTFAVNYANGTQVSLGGGGGSYGDSNVVTLLSSFGSNTVVTTGNITGGNLIATANILGNGYARLTGTFDESQASTAGLYMGYAGGTPRIMFGTGNTSQTFEIDNDSGTLRFYQPGSTKASLTAGGVFTATGNIVTGGQIQTTAFTGGNISWSTNNQIDFQGAIKVGGTGRILSPGGAASIETNNNGANIPQLRVTTTAAAANTTSGGLIVSGGAGIAGNVYAGGLISATGNITGGNLISSATIYGNPDLILGNIANTSATKTRIVTDSTFSYIQTGNGTAGTTGNIVFSPYLSSTQRVVIDTASGNITTTGNIIGSAANVTITANAFVTTFDTTGLVTFPANISVTGNVITPNRPAFRVYGNGVTNGLNVTTNGDGILNGNNWAVDYNQGGYLNSTTGVFTAPVAGLYQLNLNARCANNSAPASQAIVYKNYGTANTVQVMWEVAANTTVNHFGVSTMSKLAIGDTLTLKATTGNVTFDPNDSWSVTYIG